jgi:glutathione synthase/RimK-type ligase-like ATP-grasp enzyme
MLITLAALLPALVVNRPAAGWTNLAKPYQLQAIARAGFAVPDTLVTTTPDAARDFVARHGRVVYKSISGLRSIIATLDARDGATEARLAGVRTGPVQLQQWIAGRDHRVHVVRDRWFATAIDCAAADYRYAARDGIPLAMTPATIPARLGARLVELTRAMDLVLSGIDLRRTADGEWFCFEVNPSPGFTFYADATGQPIADAIAAVLTGA